MSEIQALKKALLHCNKELVVKGIGVFKPSYKAANLSSDGRTIVQPRFGWSFCLGNPAFLSSSATEFVLSDALAAKLLAASEQGESFEISGLGLFYKQQGCYELMPEPGHLIAANQHYGLMPLSIHKVRTVLPSDLQAPKNAAAATPSNTILKAAAVFLGFLLLSMVAFQYFTTNGQLFTKQEAGINIFGAERETLYQAPLIRERSTDINAILDGINRVADSVMFERAMASETAAMFIDSLSKIAPVVKLDSNLLFQQGVVRNSKIDEQAILKTGNRFNAAALNSPLTPLKAANESRKNVKGERAIESNKPGGDYSVNSKDNLAKNEISQGSVDKKKKEVNAAAASEATLVVVGSFRSLANAEKYKTELKAKGFIIAENKSILVGTLHRVVVVSPNETLPAEEFLAKAQKEIGAGVWILKD